MIISPFRDHYKSCVGDIQRIRKRNTFLHLVFHVNAVASRVHGLPLSPLRDLLFTCVRLKEEGRAKREDKRKKVIENYDHRNMVFNK